MNQLSRQGGSAHLIEIKHDYVPRATPLRVAAQAVLDILPAAVLLVSLIAGVFVFFR